MFRTTSTPVSYLCDRNLSGQEFKTCTAKKYCLLSHYFLPFKYNCYPVFLSRCLISIQITVDNSFLLYSTAGDGLAFPAVLTSL